MIFHFERWLRRQPEAKREEIQDQIARGGTAIWIEETQIYIVVFDEANDWDEHR